jgi:hypothetical protein
VQVIDRVVSVPRATTQRPWRGVQRREYIRRRWGFGYLGTCENASLIAAAIARRGHGKVGTLAEGFETAGMDEEVSACGVKREVRVVNGIVGIR